MTNLLTRDCASNFSRLPSRALASLALLLVAAACPAAAAPASVSATTLIMGGVVLDGTGAPGRRADVRIRGDRIVSVGHLKPGSGERVIDARGLVVAPGFIDTHSHVDGDILTHPDAGTQTRQGITTCIVGQDGDSQYPLRDFFHRVEANPVALNLASFVGQGTMRSLVMGKDYRRHATSAEIARMQDLVRQEMNSGALGLSSGLEYDPGFYASTDELVALARPVAERGGIYISHVRDEGDRVFEAFRELIRIGREAHLPAQISHIKLDTAPVWGRAREALALMRSANRSGGDVTADVYPYLFWQSTIIVLIPTRNWEDRAAWTKGLAEVGGPDHVHLTTYTPDSQWQGKTIGQIARMTGKDPVSVIQEIVHKTHGPGATGREGVVVQAMTEPDLRAFISAPRTMFCTDSGVVARHPRGAGSFPRVLGHYVREIHLLSLSAAVHKMTELPAWRMGFLDRGVVATGHKADLTLFSPFTVKDTATFENPMSPPIGIPYVLVNGVLVVDHGRVTGAHPGQVLLHRSLARNRSRNAAGSQNRISVQKGTK